MAASLHDLTQEFQPIVEQLLSDCHVRGVEMVPFFTIRDPFTQARLWRQSRSTDEVKTKIIQLRSDGATFLAHCLESVGPQSGRWATNAPPGLSWHQHGEAVDCFWKVDGQTEWDTEKRINGQNGYRVYEDQAVILGLTSLGHIGDWAHVQLRSYPSPLNVMSIQEIDRQMKARYG